MTEMWERFSFYGIRPLLILFMTAALATGGFNFSRETAGAIVGIYSACVYLSALPGGWIADRLLGLRRAVWYGGILIALGHISIALSIVFAHSAFFIGLILIVLGTGLLKPNISAMVGDLYPEGGPRRDAGFSIFYMGINLGAALGPFIAGYFAQRVDWHLGFACAGIGMSLGLVQYVAGRKHLKPAIERLAAQRKAAAAAALGTPSTPPQRGFTREEWKRLAAMAAFFVFAAIFWGAYEQAGSTLNLFGDRYSRTTILGFNFPSSWFQTVQAIFVIVLAPAFAWLWTRLGRHEPSTPAKFAFGLLFIGLSFVFLLPAAGHIQNTPGARVSPFWLIGCYFIQELGELCVSPVGLSVFTKLSPVKIVGMMLGLWFMADAVGSKVAGSAAGFMSTAPLPTIFGWVAAVCLGASVVAFLLIKPVRNLMGGIH
jgi:proton-dependent oligopeptide transporter, POT family